MKTYILRCTEAELLVLIVERLKQSPLEHFSYPTFTKIVEDIVFGEMPEKEMEFLLEELLRLNMVFRCGGNNGLFRPSICKFCQEQATRA